MFEQGKSKISIWKHDTEKIAKLFQEKKYAEAEEPMLVHIESFMLALYDVNNDTCSEDCIVSNDLEVFKYKPFNVQERVDFIIQNPKQYHSYIQLNELYKELEKIYARAEIISNQNGK